MCSITITLMKSSICFTQKYTSLSHVINYALTLSIISLFLNSLLTFDPQILMILHFISSSICYLMSLYEFNPNLNYLLSLNVDSMVLIGHVWMLIKIIQNASLVVVLIANSFYIISMFMLMLVLVLIYSLYSCCGPVIGGIVNY